MKAPSILLVIICSLLAFTAWAELPLQPEKSNIIQLGTFTASPFTSPQGQGLLDRLMKGAFKRCCKLDVKITTLPAERSLKLADKGLVDGELPRIANISGLNSNFLNLVQVDVSIMPTTFVAFTKNPAIHMQRWEELEPYNIGLVTGWKILEKNILKYRSLTKFDNAKKLFTALGKNRVDIVVFNRLLGLTTIKKLGLKGIYGGNSPAFKTNKDKWFLYMHKKHKNLVPRLEKALLDMKKDGSYEKIYCQSLAASLPDKEADLVIMNALAHLDAKRGKHCRDVVVKKP